VSWWFAFGYFACYAPYAALTRAVTKGLLPGQTGPVSGFEILPLSVATSLVGMLIFLRAKGWFAHATQASFLGRTWPVPTRWTALSGVCTAAIVLTTTLAYTFTGVSIVFIMLLMRGGVLVLAPITDAIARRKVAWTSWVALLLSLAALIVAERGGDYRMTAVTVVDVVLYLLGYFVRLRFMSRLAKSDDERATLRYFVEEQLMGTPLLLLLLAGLAVLGHPGSTSEWGRFTGGLRAGFTTFFDRDLAVVATVAVIGLLSQGTGIFGALILLDRRENTFCVPVNRASSILAGVVGSAGLALTLGDKWPSGWELVGAALVVTAIAVLAMPTLLARPRAPQGTEDAAPVGGDRAA
jgi:general stress protein CsbA